MFGVQIINPGSCIATLYYLQKMTNQNITQCGTQTAGLGVIIGKCSLIANMEDLFGILQMLDTLFFRYTNDKQSNPSNQRLQCRKCTREDNKPVLYCYFRSNPTQRGYRKRMIEIWLEYARFKTTNQMLTDQVRNIINKGWFSDLEILEIHQQIYKEYTTTIETETLNAEMP